MASRTIVIAASLLALLVSTAAAQDPGVGPSSSHDCDGGVDGMDAMCWHEDCGQHGCTYTFCPVYLPHSGHLHDRLFGCTPP